MRYIGPPTFGLKYLYTKSENLNRASDARDTAKSSLIFDNQQKSGTPACQVWEGYFDTMRQAFPVSSGVGSGGSAGFSLRIRWTVALPMWISVRPLCN